LAKTSWKTRAVFLKKVYFQVVHEKRRDHACGYCTGVAFGAASGLKAHISMIHLKIKRSRGAK
jgi:hypothetical protein